MTKPLSRRIRTRAPLLALALAAIAVTAACKASPAPNSGFILDRPEAAKPEGIPFHKFWTKPGFAWGKYKRIMFSPVDTAHLLPSNAVLTAGTNKTDNLATLSAYARASFEEAFRDDPRHLYKVVKTRGPRTLDFEIAITELVPGRPLVNAVTYMFIYMPFQRGTVAIEGRVRDAATGEVVVTFADRENAKFYPFNVNDFDRLGHPRLIIDGWAGQLVGVAHRQGSDKVEDQKRIGLKPW